MQYSNQCEVLLVDRTDSFGFNRTNKVQNFLFSFLNWMQLHFLLSLAISSSFWFKSDIFPLILEQSYSAVMVLMSFNCFGEIKFWDGMILALDVILLGLFYTCYFWRFCFWGLNSFNSRSFGFERFVVRCVFSYKFVNWMFYEFLLIV